MARKQHVVNQLGIDPGRRRTSSTLDVPTWVDQMVPFGDPDRQSLIDAIVSDITGIGGPIQILLDDPGISEVMINGPEDVYIERAGKLEKTAIRFRDTGHLRLVIETMLEPSGRGISDNNTLVDARLPDGSRLNVVTSPVSIFGDVVTIRKFTKTPWNLDNLVGKGTMSDAMRKLLEAAVVAKRSIIVSGGTGSGKTTLLNALSSCIPKDERIVSIEDVAELRLQKPHRIALESRPSRNDLKEIPIRDLVRNALRMRPDRIIIGEVRGGEALDMLQALNTGHEGGLATLHANTPRDCLSRLETMVLMAGEDLPLSAIRQQISSAVHMIVQIGRNADGSRRVSHISEVIAMEGDVITMQDIFTYERFSAHAGHSEGRFTATGIRPKFFDALQATGYALPPLVSPSAERRNRF